MLSDRCKSLAGSSSEFRLVRDHKLEESRLEDELEVRLGTFGEDIVDAITDLYVDSPRVVH